MRSTAMAVVLMCASITATASEPQGDGPAALHVHESPMSDAQPPAEDSLEQDEDQDLAGRLIRQATGQTEPGLMGDIMNLMTEAAQRLGQDFDAGKATRSTQDQIIKKLDEAIATAQRRKRQGSSQTQPTGDKRKAKPTTGEQKQGDTSPTQDAEAPADSAAATDGETKQSTPTGRLREFRRGWGHLPDRDRDEVLQGIDEQVLERYRPLIERYYRALAEDEQE